MNTKLILLKTIEYRYLKMTANKYNLHENFLEEFYENDDSFKEFIERHIDAWLTSMHADTLSPEEINSYASLDASIGQATTIWEIENYMKQNQKRYLRYEENEQAISERMMEHRKKKR